jgi:hypothetical protein
MQGSWTGQVHPNISEDWYSFEDKYTVKCTRENHPTKLDKPGCLFDVLADPEERHDLALEMPEKAKELAEKLKEATKGWYNPFRGQGNKTLEHEACKVAHDTGFYQPYLD